MKKSLVSGLYLWGGKILKDPKKLEYRDETLTTVALEYQEEGCDELFFMDLSNKEKDYEELLQKIRELREKITIPIICCCYLNTLEDVKKLLYAGVSKVCLPYDFANTKDLIEKSAKRFGKEKISILLSFSDEAKKRIHDIEHLVSRCYIEESKSSADEEKVSFTGMLSSMELFYMTSSKNLKEDKSLYGGNGVNGIVFLTSGENFIDFFKIKEELKKSGVPVGVQEHLIPFTQLKVNQDGLVPVVVQDYKTQDVLMVAYMNEKAYEQTLETKRMTYWSRSRKELWVKGETSGCTQSLKALWIDCDQDTILAKVEQQGNACHTGAPSCFFNHVIEEKGKLKNSYTVFENLYQTIVDRKMHPKEGSYTNYLLKEGTDKILKKIGEEASEIIIAAKNPNPEEIKYEMADFFYHAFVLMVEKNISLEEVVEELSRR